MDEQSIPTIPNTQLQDNNYHKFHFYISPYLLSLATLFIGVILGYFYVKEFPKNNVGKNINLTNNQEILVPGDAVVIESCSDHQGTLYLRPSDVPIGPIYMVNNGKVIGLEYMLDRNQFLSGKTFDNLPAFNLSINHTKIFYLDKGHAGNNDSHYHVDLYIVSKDVEQGIVCKDSGKPAGSINMDTTHSSVSAIPTLMVTSTVLPQKDSMKGSMQ